MKGSKINFWFKEGESRVVRKGEIEPEKYEDIIACIEEDLVEF